MKFDVINTEKAPAALGPYSQAVKAGNMLFISGQIPVDPKTGEIAEGDIQAKTKQVMENAKAVLAEAGADFNDVVKTTVFIKSMDDFAAINEIYAQYFVDNKPARSCVEVARLPKDVTIEMELIAVL